VGGLLCFFLGHPRKKKFYPGFLSLLLCVLKEEARKSTREKAVNSRAGYLSGGRKTGVNPPSFALILRISIHPGTALNGARNQRVIAGPAQLQTGPSVKTKQKNNSFVFLRVLRGESLFSVHSVVKDSWVEKKRPPERPLSFLCPDEG